MRAFIIILAAFAFVSSAHAGEAGTSKCDALCQDYKAAHPTSPNATPIPLICIRFKQDADDNVVMTLKNGRGGTIREYTKTAHPDDEFCIGRQWIEAEGLDKIQLCNGVRTEVLSQKHIAILKASGMPVGSFACLFGEGKCNKLTKVVQ
ncbi:MAG TPA: hypothetical protein VMR46_03420 [Candidatus Paceibacterota bacterium]|jgi:hypothetical protein|nr:hypothetical protein [Candidatus Paceibacterota bacterium]